MTSPFRGNDGTARSVASIARDPAGPARVLRDVERFAALDQRVRECIPAAARRGIGIARVDGDCLVIAADGPAHATRARLLADDLLEAARRHWPAPLKRTRVVVVPGAEFKP